MMVRPCLRSGLCCKKAPCAFGHWDEDRGQCAFLLVDQVLPNGAEVHACGIHNLIDGEPGAEWNPAFGAGCCMAMFNDARDLVAEGIRNLRSVNHK